MSRPLFEIAQEVSADWKNPSPQAKTYLKGMYYLLGMDDRVADLDAATAVRMFLLYSKEWLGPIADKIKAELKGMRLAHLPTNADLLSTSHFAARVMHIDSCELCNAPFGTPAKCVQAYTHWNVCAHMCMHCALFVSPGVDVGDGAVYMLNSDGIWCHLHGKANASPACTQTVPRDRSKIGPRSALRPKLRHRLKLFGRKVVKKCAKIVGGLLRRSA
jgi:hypothetical protein